MNSTPGKLMDARELEAYLGITKNATYNLFNRDDFPHVQLGGRHYAIRAEVDVWLVEQAKKGGYKYGQERAR